MKLNVLITGALAGLLATTICSAHPETHGARPDSHAPIGVMADHMHKKGEWMFSYRYMHMAMEGNRDGNNRVSVADVHTKYRVAPLKMDMGMHMLGAMYAPSDKVTFMVMVPYLENKMDHQTVMGGFFTTESKGVGDIKLAAMLPLYDYDGGKMHTTLGVSVPTGSIDERDQTPMGNAQLPYPMQLGSGTYDLRPSITWAKLNQGWSWGAQTTATIRTGGKNSNGYRLGNVLDAQTWLAWNPSAAWSFSSRLQWQSWKDIEGQDPAYNMGLMVDGNGRQLVPTIDPALRGGQRTDLHVGLNWLSQGGHRLALEYGMPVQQKLDGPQLEVDSVATVGYQYAF